MTANAKDTGVFTAGVFTTLACAGAVAAIAVVSWLGGWAIGYARGEHNGQWYIRQQAIERGLAIYTDGPGATGGFTWLPPKQAERPAALPAILFEPKRSEILPTPIPDPIPNADDRMVLPGPVPPTLWRGYEPLSDDVL